VSQILSGCDVIASQALQLLDIRKSASLFAGPDQYALQTDVKNASCTRDKSDTAQFLFKRCQQLLRHPGGTEQPAALGAIFNLYAGPIGRYLGL
jgi:hypothetical protein